MEDQKVGPSPEQLKMMRSNYVRTMKDDVQILELEQRFWKAKYESLLYKSEHAKLEGIISQQLSEMEAMTAQMQDEVLNAQEKSDNVERDVSN
jgi:hypothetical protein